MVIENSSKTIYQKLFDAVPLSDNLIFSHLSKADVEGLCEYSFNEKFYEFMEVEPMVSQPQVEEYIARLIDRQLRESGSPKAVYWAVRRKEDGVFIGTIGLLNLQAERRHAEWGFGVDPNFWESGIILDMLNSVLAFAYGNLGLNKVYSTTHFKNERVINLLSALKFKEEGVLREYYLHHSGYHFDAKIFALLRSEYFRTSVPEAHSDKHANIEVAVINIVQGLFPYAEINIQSNMNNVIGWDSVSHIDVILEVENQFGATIATADVATVTSVVKLAEVIGTLVQSAHNNG